MASSLMDADDSDGIDSNLDAGAIESLDEAKMRIRELNDERKRKMDYMRRLEKKLQTLDEELSQKRMSVEGIQRSLALEQSKHQLENESRRREKADKVYKQKEMIRDYLSEVLYSKPHKKGNDYTLDMVLVSFMQPGSPMRYNLNYRIDKETTIKTLRQKACKYWGVSEEEYILKTMSNSKCQNDLQVQDCFKQGEIAQLRLEVRNQTNTEITEAEKKAIQPKSGRKAKERRALAEGPSGLAGNGMDGYLSQMTGTYFLLKLRDMKPSEHHYKIKLRDIVMYSLMAFLTFYVYSMRRPEGAEYWVGQTINQHFFETGVHDPPGHLIVERFEDITTTEGMITWIQKKLVPKLYQRNKGLRWHNFPMGYLGMRIQSVREPSYAWEHCQEYKEIIQEIQGAVCYPMEFDAEEESKIETLTFVEAYWNSLIPDAPGAEVRGPTKPYHWMDEKKGNKDHGLSSLAGRSGSYDTSGYLWDYKFAVTDMSDSAKLIKQDLTILTQLGMVDLNTRMVVCSFTLYNFNYDFWTSVELLFEMPPAGVVVPTAIVRVFKPNLNETPAESDALYIDIMRVVIVFYIIVIVLPTEKRHKEKNHKAGYWYLLSLNGIMDIFIIICTFTIVIWRAIVFIPVKTEERYKMITDNNVGFVSLSGIAQDYEQLFVCEGILFICVMFRMLALIRLNRNVYFIWHVIGESMKYFAFFLFLGSPIFLGFAVIAHTIWGRYYEAFEYMDVTFVSILLQAQGKLDVDKLLKVDTLIAMLVITLVFISLNWVFCGIFSAMLIDAYYAARLTHGYTREAHGWDRTKYYDWVMPALLVNMVTAYKDFTKGAGEAEPAAG